MTSVTPTPTLLVSPHPGADSPAPWPRPPSASCPPIGRLLQLTSSPGGVYKAGWPVKNSAPLCVCVWKLDTLQHHIIYLLHPHPLRPTAPAPPSLEPNRLQPLAKLLRPLLSGILSLIQPLQPLRSKTHTHPCQHCAPRSPSPLLQAE